MITMFLGGTFPTAANTATMSVGWRGLRVLDWTPGLMWPFRLVATAAENRLSFRHNPHLGPWNLATALYRVIWGVGAF
jgi:hypothetical protein